MNRRVGILTFHKSLSYGGCLQAYATYLLMRDFGYDAEFVDYENPYEARQKNAHISEMSGCKEIVSTLVKHVLFKQRKSQKRAFSSFHEEMPRSKPCGGKKDLDSLYYDVLLVGSDQVWNPEITNGIDTAFFLDFGKAEKRLSLSSSVGSHVFNDEEKKIVQRCLAPFDAVSVRESFAKEQIQNILDRPVRVTLDPTLFIDRALWSKESIKYEDAPAEYILVFMVSNSYPHYEKLLTQIKGILKLPVIMVRLNTARPHGIDHVVSPTPRELIWLISHAALVLTDSFHGLAFSINMRSRFIALPNIRNNVRLNELLNMFDLSDRMATDQSLKPEMMEEPDWTPADNKLPQLRASDVSWLKGSLSA